LGAQVQGIGAVGELAGQYDAVLCDVWGVLHDGRTVYPGAGDALRGLRAAGVAVVLLTNMPRPSSTMPAALARLRFPPDAWDAIVTSGDAIRLELARRAPGPVLRVGRSTDLGLWDGLGLRFVEAVDEAQLVAIAGLRDGETPAEYASILRAAVDRGLDLMCANPDVQIRSAGELQWCAGALAEAYEALGGRVVQAGKPHVAIYERAYEALATVTGRDVPRERILAIGDGPATDLLGANRQGIDSLFIASGIHGDTLLREGAIDLGRAAAVLDAADVTATYAMGRLT
jgi:HAD superfamily hydrolase (TIGR01459 family)